MFTPNNLPTKTCVRKYLSAEALNTSVRNCLDHLPDFRCQKVIQISQTDALMAGLAMFQFKDPSLLAFQNRCKDEVELQNIKDIYGIKRVPAYSSMSDILIDQVQQIACPLFRAVLSKLKQKKEVWEHMRSLFKSYAVDSIETIWKAIVYGFNKPNLESFDTSSEITVNDFFTR